MRSAERRRTVTVREEIHGVSPGRVWETVADLTRMGEWSPECTGGRWLDGNTGPVPGARFSGTNRKGPIRWSTRCTITRAAPGHTLFWEVRLGLPIARWGFTLTPNDRGTLVEQTWHDLRVGPFGALAAMTTEAVLRTGSRAEHNERTMRATLAALRDHLQTPPAHR
ncbi:SRPBCC family protein [Streptomyces sp. NPDC006879]|uniref:SRPBCC family protein n=1 Tax=Streptomyces sp. NPDC006879 TaxID=3364767 RepID=UPI00369CF260